MSKNKHNRNNQYRPNSIETTNVEPVLDVDTYTYDPINNNVDNETTVSIESGVDVSMAVDTESMTTITVDEIAESTESIIETSTPDVSNVVDVIEASTTEIADNVEVCCDVYDTDTGAHEGYQVGLNFPTDGVCVDFDHACKIANELTKTVGEVHHVFDSMGNIVFSAKKKLILLSYKNKKAGTKNANWYT